jgi:DNA-directed RNA polymerase sigma subunit (sigma70/sigma32)
VTRSVEDEALERVEMVQVLASLRALDDLHRSVLVLRYGLSGDRPRSQADVAAQLGLTQWRARRLEVEALARLRAGFPSSRSWVAQERRVTQMF